ncbi:HNH endonuclease signature motif containing protein [Brevibacterium jeotgali]|uniref:HNH nuclease domain-containing protein n=1 Tax=Brevibacterium jeotgali TaxID=1262550 RepID=A0A2H1L1G3_9MICO|nr:HNH endonuclease signature motif containing protein [Brevibacterium jeotgali]TWC01902.1 uncharacterized protein DUF222 [Brevibacterium jeotgali]SMY10747.1 protein of unknown function (DUF222) [Brevibacterium jeotgali]
MTTAHSPDGSVEAPAFRVPFSDADRELLVGRAPDLVELIDLGRRVRASRARGSLGTREVLAAVRSLEVVRRAVDSLSTDLLATYQRIGDSSVHGYRTTEALLAGEFRITPREARRRTHLCEYVAGRISETGDVLEPLRPAIADTFADGRISADEARALCDAIDDLPSSARAMHADAVEKTLVELAPAVRLKDLPKLTQRIIDHVDPDGKLPKFETDPHRYKVNLFQQRNGDWRLSGLLDCPSGTTLHALLYHRMKDADVPVSVRPHRECTDDPSATQVSDDGAAGAGAADPGMPGADLPGPVALSSEGPQRGSSDGASQRGSARQGTAGSESTAGRPSSGGVPHDDHEYSVTSAQGDDDVPIPTIPREAVWEGTRITVHADARVEIEGASYTLDEDEPQFVLNADGWPFRMRKAIARDVQALLERVRAEGVDVLESVVWEKILGRRPVSDAGGADPDAVEIPDEVEAADPGSPRSGGPPGDAVYEYDPGGRVFADGSRSRSFAELKESDSPGLARHDRFAFLLRCAARERVLHGADHALVVTARADELDTPDALFSTHAGGPVTLTDLEGRSNAAQTFLHLVDGGGRTVEVRSQGRFATRSQMAVLAARDQGCTFPDCDAPAEWCEAHHILAYARGGKTEIDNLTLVCPFHHRWFERSGWDSVFRRGLPGWLPPQAVDPRRRTLFHSRFRVALLGLPPELPLSGA